MKFSNIFEFSNSNSLFLENIQVPSLFDKQTTLNNSFSTVNNFFGNNPFFDKILNIDFFENLTFNSLLLDTFIVFNNILNNQFFYETFFSTFNNVHFFSLNNVNDLTFLFLSDDSDFYLKSLNIYIDKIDDISLFQNLENITSTYHYSIPNVKLAYPEPFIASPSFIHSDLWFTHITVFQY
jgi:hypothetical protein